MGNIRALIIRIRVLGPIYYNYNQGLLVIIKGPRMRDLGFKVWAVGSTCCKTQLGALAVCGSRIGKHSWFRVQGLGFRAQGLGSRVEGLGLRVQGSEFRV